MDESFELPVLYKSQELYFTSQLLVYGYSHKIEVDVYGTKISFEPDEERNYRAILDSKQIQKNDQVDIELLKAIAQAIESIVK
jgi:hypothetical protein